MKLSLVLLVKNEIVGLRWVFDRIPLAAADEVLAVDGGSRDGSREFLRDRGIPVHDQRVTGRGEAFRVAFDEAAGDALLFFSPDGNEDPADIPRFRPLLEQGFDMVVGNRMTSGGRNEEDDRLLRWRKWANRGFTWAANATWNRGPKLADSINGFRAITRGAWERIAPSETGYTIEYQCTIRALKRGLRIAEFPTRESRRIDERAGSPGIPTGLAFLRLYFRELRR